jgi:hypothetical protein
MEMIQINDLTVDNADKSMSVISIEKNISEAHKFEARVLMDEVDNSFTILKSGGASPSHGMIMKKKKSPNLLQP